jgi:hypothetical protein
VLRLMPNPMARRNSRSGFESGSLRDGLKQLRDLAQQLTAPLPNGTLNFFVRLDSKRPTSISAKVQSRLLHFRLANSPTKSWGLSLQALRTKLTGARYRRIFDQVPNCKRTKTLAPLLSKEGIGPQGRRQCSDKGSR